jgi:multidrug efflux pump subunit AcrB
MPIRDLTTFADEEVKERLQRVPGVGSVELVGGREREMRIWLDASAMRARGIARDTSRFIEQAIGDVLFDLFIAVLLVVAVTFLFLLSWRATIIVLLAIPTSIVSTFVAFAAFTGGQI